MRLNSGRHRASFPKSISSAEIRPTFLNASYKAVGVLCRRAVETAYYQYK